MNSGLLMRIRRQWKMNTIEKVRELLEKAASQTDVDVDDVLEHIKEHEEIEEARDIVVLVKTGTSYLGCEDDEWDGLHVVWLEDVSDGETYFIGTDGISRSLPVGVEDGVLYEDDDIVVATDDIYACLEDLEGKEVMWKTEQGEAITYIKDAEVDEERHNWFVVVYMQVIGDMLRTPLLIVDCDDRDMTEDDVKDLLDAAAKHYPEKYHFGEFNVPWANHYVVRYTEASPEVAAKCDDVERVSVYELEEIANRDSD